ncbi:GDP-mannose transporter into the lumen of the Golgi [Podila epigama]|nr:GDP-mannose transporter into the lumen of the Golgi [Podila epigama]
MVGSLNKLPVAASGILFLGEPATTGNVLGIFFGFIAGMLFSYSKSDHAKKEGMLSLANNASLARTPLMSEVGGDAAAIGGNGGGEGGKSEDGLLPKTMGDRGKLPLFKSD